MPATFLRLCRLGLYSLAIGLFLPSLAPADIVEREVADEEGVGVYVLQGSRNMRDLGRRSRVVESGRVPSLATVHTVIPALETEELRYRPRFGFGSDWQAGDPQATGPGPVEPVSRPVFEPRAVYHYRFHYPVYREYFVGYPRLYLSPCASPFPARFGSVHRSVSFRFFLR